MLNSNNPQIPTHSHQNPEPTPLSHRTHHSHTSQHWSKDQYPRHQNLEPLSPQAQQLSLTSSNSEYRDPTPPITSDNDTETNEPINLQSFRTPVQHSITQPITPQPQSPQLGNFQQLSIQPPLLQQPTLTTQQLSSLLPTTATAGLPRTPTIQQPPPQPMQPPTRQQPPQQSSSSMAQDPKLPKPSIFMGEPEHYRTWKEHLKLYVTKTSSVSMDVQKITATLLFMGGQANEWR
ncbi:hypothetical protein P691DRAFT_765438 [Macrolepiota fuliginosa MF-IS2]|uniref:Uncharacterized protein n=1 Tax=Macrolepiota fuliginosa MF-IS2 TaxID=1400762 RepID=A0A9P5X2H9_9AGAR|nr:hypothetical protein P691DRAFT_765438 [Macrolepiota fuliginosa MF-IS2]